MAENRNTLTLVQTDANAIVVREKEDTKREIAETRQKLGEMTLRDFSEGLFGEGYTEIVYGKDGGQIKMNDLKMSMAGSPVPGEVGLKLDDQQMVEIIMEAHPGLTRNDALALLTATPELEKQKALQLLAEHEQTVDDDLEEAHKTFKDIMRGEVDSIRRKP